MYVDTWALLGDLALEGLQESLHDVVAHSGYEPSFKLGVPRPQTLGYGGVCAQEEGEIESQSLYRSIYIYIYIYIYRRLDLP